MANTTINSATVNSVSVVSKEETIMATITIKNMAITNKHDANYVSKAMLGEALGYSKTKLLNIKREDLVKEMTEKLAPKMTEEQLCNAVNAVVDVNANGSNAVIELPKELNKSSKEETDMISMNELEEKELTEKETEEMIRENKKVEEIKKVETEEERTTRRLLMTIQMLKDILEASERNEKNGYGSKISGKHLSSIIVKQWGIKNLNNALKNDEKTRNALILGLDRPGKILITNELLKDLADIKKWLLSENIISEGKFSYNEKKKINLFVHEVSMDNIKNHRLMNLVNNNQ
jgi:hypothetical protein